MQVLNTLVTAFAKLKDFNLVSHQAPAQYN